MQKDRKWFPMKDFLKGFLGSVSGLKGNFEIGFCKIKINKQDLSHNFEAV